MIVSIDIGTSYSSMSMLGKDGKSIPVAIGEDGTAWGSKVSLPSAVFVEENGNILVGQAAMRSRLRKPECFRMEFKRNLGEDTPLLLGGRSFRVEELYTELLLHMKACVKKTTGEDIELVYLTCPATYRKDKKERLISAAKAAGLFQVELVPEPTAAAMSYVSAGYVKDGQTLLVYDFGGGTFDAALIQYKGGAFLPLGEPLGLPRCGGIDMDRLIYQDMMKAVDPDTIAMLQKKQEHYLRFAGQLSEKAVQIKHQLSSAHTATEYIPMGWEQLEYTLTRQAFEEMIAPMIDQTIHVCEDALTSAGLKKSDLSAVVLVGGTSRVPLVQQMVQQFAGKVPVYVAPDVDLAVVQGALSYRQYNSGAMAEKWYQDAKELEEQDGSSVEIAALYQKAAEQGHADAQYILGLCLKDGIGIQKDSFEAAKWFRKAAEQGHAQAQCLLGSFYILGTGVSVNPWEGVKWYRKSAEQGYATAQYCLGSCYECGKGVEEDIEEALKWYRQAAEQGYADAKKRYDMLINQSKSTSSGSVNVSYKNEEKTTPKEPGATVGAGASHTVGLRSDGTVVATGDNNDGQCNVNSWRDIIAVTAGGNHTVGLRSDGRLETTGVFIGICHGESWNNIIAVAAGDLHTVGLRSDGTVVATGDNNDGQCNVNSWRDIIAVTAGGNHTVGLRSDGRLETTGVFIGICHGESWNNIIAVAAGGLHTVGLRSDGTVAAAGNNSFGQCNVESWHDIIAIAAGSSHTVGLRSDGTVVATGENDGGQCNVSGWHEIIAVAVGYKLTVGLRSNGTVVATGNNSCGQCNVESWKLF